MKTGEVFALDIGTRTIAGLILATTDEGVEIKKALVHQQLPGAMADGQIHHIDAVAHTLSKIKQELEQACDTPINKVAVAAAGRSLLTATGRATLALRPNHRLSADEVRALELDAVRDAVEQLSGEQADGVIHSYLCVGYSVIKSYLDGEPIGALQDHQGTEAETEIIATFLPRIVIDSLGTSLETAGLDVDSLTLEPIAAMHVVVPATMRMLNIALVDVGAGTSDLAISAHGTVKGYGMVSYAGDAVTKGLADHFLLDFKVAERLKVELKADQFSHCQDVFGNPLDLSYEEVVAVMQPQVEILAEKIASAIIELNGSAPKGVILIGGGSRVPGLENFLAQKLSIPENLVRMRDRSTLEMVKGFPDYNGPEVITPIGIGCSHLDGRAMELIQVTVNDQNLQFLNLASSTVADALMQAGLVPSELVGRPGPAFTVELNGRYIPLPGSLGEPAIIKKNDQRCDLSAPLASADTITVDSGQAGKAPQVTLGEFLDVKAQLCAINLNGSPLEVKPSILVNGDKQPFSYTLQDRDKITLQPISNFEELFDQLHIPLEREISFFLNEENRFAVERLELVVDGTKKPLSTALRPGLEASYHWKACTLRDVLNTTDDVEPEIVITINGQQQKLRRKKLLPQVNGQEMPFDYIIRPLDRIIYQSTGAASSYIVTDIFLDYVPDEIFTKKGGQILVNGQKAGYTTPLSDGDKVELVPYGAGIANS